MSAETHLWKDGQLAMSAETYLLKDGQLAMSAELTCGRMVS